MKIGFDGKRAVMNNTGLGNYSRLLVDVLSSRFPEHDYLLFTPRNRYNSRLEPLLERPNVSIVTPDTAMGKAASSIWRIKNITSQFEREKVDLYHGLSGELPLNLNHAVPSVVTIHDLIFRRFPSYYKAVDREIYDYKFSHAARNADRVIAISECTKRDIVNDYGIDPERVDVVYQGCHNQFHRTPTSAEIDRLKLKYGLDRPYIISVGTIESRKNQIECVRGVRGLPDDLDVVLVGRRTAYARTIDSYIHQYNMGNRVKFIENAEFADLPALYAGAFCSSYTSRYEGFGIPVIESLSVGTPVVVATGSCLEEAGGPDTPAVDPDDVEEWITIVKEMYDHPDILKSIAKQGQRYVQRFNDDAMAAGTMRAYRRAFNEAPIVPADDKPCGDLTY